MRVLLATTNEGKIKELNRILARADIDLDIELVGLGDLAANGEIETGATFAENALLKARHYHKLLRLTTIADDSGLEVEALGGGPGIYSARFGGPGIGDADRTRKLLEKMQDVPVERRSARFVCVAAIVWDGGERTFEGQASGAIGTKPKGEGGFGYDAVFLCPPLGRTFAELNPDEKARVSHRGKAFDQVANWLRETGLA